MERAPESFVNDIASRFERRGDDQPPQSRRWHNIGAGRPFRSAGGTDFLAVEVTAKDIGAPLRSLGSGPEACSLQRPVDASPADLEGRSNLGDRLPLPEESDG